MKVLAILFLLVSSAFGQTSMDFVWEDQFDLAGRTDQALGVAVSSTRAVAIGVGSTVNGGVDLLFRAYDPKTGSLAWQDQAPLSAGYISGVVIDELDDKVFGAGYAPDSSGAGDSGADILVRSYDATTGNRLWEDVANKGRDDFVQAIAAGPYGVYVVAYGGNVNNSPLDFLIRAYDKSTGRLLWEDQVDNGGDDVAWNVATQGNRVFVAGSKSNSPIAPWDLILRAYDAVSGVLAWEATYPNALPASLAVSNGRVYVGGLVSGGSGFLFAYNSLTGELLWEKAATGTILDLAATDTRIFASGSMLRAYDATGALVWEVAAEQTHAIDLSRNLIFMAGAKQQYVESEVISSEFLVRAYNADTGALLYEDLSHESKHSFGWDIASSALQVFAVGWANNLNRNPDLLIRSYRLILQPSLPPEPTPAPSVPPTPPDPVSPDPAPPAPQPAPKEPPGREKVKKVKRKPKEKKKKQKLEVQRYRLGLPALRDIASISKA